MAKILAFDLESTHLKADFGTLLCVGYRWLHEKKVHCLAITDYDSFKNNATDDRKLLVDFIKVLDEADIIVTYYGKCFDWPYLQAKSLEYGMGPLPTIPHVDLYFTVKSNMCISRKSLANVSEYLCLDAKKTPVLGRVWKRAMTGHHGSIKYIVRHCIADIELLVELYEKLRPLVRSHPKINGNGPCRFCGSEKLQKRGKLLSVLKGARERVQCQSCAGWDSRDGAA